jgi:LacI family transcriptional regulator
LTGATEKIKIKGTKSISIKEIAQICGVSTATVSRVLNDNGRFSNETKNKVLQTVEKLGYKTNNIAKSLRTKKTRSIGIIVPDITNEYFANIILAIQNFFFPQGYSVLVYNTNEDQGKEDLYLKDLEAKCVDGLIYFFCMEDRGQIDAIRKKIPVVFVDRNPNRKGAVVVESDNYTGGFLATEELIKSGCRNIVILRHILTNSTIVGRYKGYRDALNKYGIPFNPDLVLDMYVNANASKEAICRLIECGIAFDGVFACTDWLAVGALMALRKHNIKVPQQVKVVGFDNVSISEYSSPSITTINQDKTRLGEIAAQLLLDMIDGNSIDEKNIILPVELIKRETT